MNLVARQLALRVCAGVLIVCLAACSSDAGLQESPKPPDNSQTGQTTGDKASNEQKENDTQTRSGEDMAASNEKLESATFAGGCFWCVEAVFLQLNGVKSVRAGYMGGTVENPTYEQVCAGTTGHAEVIQIEFNPEEIAFEKLLEVFFLTHDPTTLNRQGNDIGTQYRSAIFWHTEQQRNTADAIRKRLDEEKVFSSPIVTEITKAEKFWVAEDYHQNFYARNPGQPYCEAVIPEKIRKLRKVFGDHLRDR